MKVGKDVQGIYQEYITRRHWIRVHYISLLFTYEGVNNKPVPSIMIIVSWSFATQCLIV